MDGVPVYGFSLGIFTELITNDMSLAPGSANQASVATLKSNQKWQLCAGLYSMHICSSSINTAVTWYFFFHSPFPPYFTGSFPHPFVFQSLPSRNPDSGFWLPWTSFWNKSRKQSAHGHLCYGKKSLPYGIRLLQVYSAIGQSSKWTLFKIWHDSMIEVI